MTPPVASLVPHAGPMCLIDQVLDWDEHRIRCEATVSEVHPLKVGARLPATALIEYAAQAMAAHGRLLALASAGDGRAGDGSADDDSAADTAGPKPGMLVGLRAIELDCRWVDHRRLDIRVDRLGGDALSVLYGFEVYGAEPGGPAPEAGLPASAATALAKGRAIVTLERPR